MNKDYPSLIKFVAGSKRRKQVLILLTERKISQPEIKRLTGMYKTHTSRALAELAKKDLIDCINPKDRAYKFYKITPKGKRIMEEVKRITE